MHSVFVRIKVHGEYKVSMSNVITASYLLNKHAKLVLLFYLGLFLLFFKDNPKYGESLSSKAFLTFNITDVDDLNPKFTNDTYTVRLDADTLPVRLSQLL